MEVKIGTEKLLSPKNIVNHKLATEQFGERSKEEEPQVVTDCVSI